MMTPLPVDGAVALSLMQRNDAAGSPGDISFLLRVIIRRRWRILAAAACGLALGLLAFVLMPSSFVASSQIVIDFRRLAVIAPNEATFNYRMSDAAVDTQVAIVTSDAVLRRAVDTLGMSDPAKLPPPGLVSRLLVWTGLADDPKSLSPNELRDAAVIRLRKMLSIERDGLSYMFTIGAKSDEPELAAAVANAVAQAYVADQFAARSEIAAQAHQWFKDRLTELQGMAADALRAAADFRGKNQIVIASGRYVDEQQIEDLSIRMLGAQNRRVMAEARLQQVQSVLDGKKGDAVAASGSMNEELRNPIIVGLLTKYNDLNSSYAENLRRYGPEHEVVQRIQAEMAETQKAMDAEFRRVAESLRSEAAIARDEERNMGDMLAELSRKATDSQKSRVELGLLENSADSYNKLRDFFVSQYSAATQQETYPVNETRLLSMAAVPFQPVAPKLRNCLIGGTAAGLALGLLWVFGAQAFERRLRTRAQLEEAVGRRCLGYVVKLDGRDKKGGWFGLGPRRALPDRMSGELMLSILLNIRRFSIGQQRKVLGVTGPTPGQGASFFSAALAMTVANRGGRALVVDMDNDMRGLSLRLARTLERAAGPAGSGSSPAVVGGLEIVQHPAVPGLHFLTVPEDRQAATAREARLTGDRLREFLDEAQRSFDLVVLDLPPLMPLTTTRLLASSLESILLVVGWRECVGAEVADLLQANGEIKDRLIGAVYNRVPVGGLAEVEDPTLAEMAAIMRRKARSGDRL